MKEYYECHITIETDLNKDVRGAVESLGWKHSCIAGDPVLGDRTFEYATKHFNCKRDIDNVVEIVQLSARLLAGMGLKIVRHKVERVVYDSRRHEVEITDKGKYMYQSIAELELDERTNNLRKRLEHVEGIIEKRLGELCRIS